MATHGEAVAAEKYPHGLHRLLGLAETLREHGEVTNEVRAMGLIPPPAAVRGRLGLPPGEDVVYVERLRRLNGLPLSLDLTYLVREVGEPLFDADLVHNDVFVLLERIAGPGAPRRDVVLPATLLVRQSCAPHPAVQEARTIGGQQAALSVEPA